MVNAFPGINNLDFHPNWLDEWFTSEIAVTKPDAEANDITVTLADVLKSVASKQVSLQEPLKILSVWPQYFRGFRQFEKPITFDGDLVVLDGRNSSGKTSVTEALEFLLTGRLERRERNDQGNAKELENCIQCQLRPDDEKTWVEGQFLKLDGSIVQIRRVLTADYGPVGTSRCSSDFYEDGTLLSSEEEREFLEKHFASDAPLLMQHTLREFVHSDPKARRNYFERLLMMDEITLLINKAVISNARLAEFPPPSGREQLDNLKEFVNYFSNSASKAAHKTLINDPSSIDGSLQIWAINEFDCVTDKCIDLEKSIDAVRAEQVSAQKAKFPLLHKLKPQKLIDESLEEALSLESVKSDYKAYKGAVSSLQTANDAAKAFGEIEILLAPVIQSLIDAELIGQDVASQECPLCESVESLEQGRVSTILSVKPATDAVSTAKVLTTKSTQTIVSRINLVEKLLVQLVPNLVADDDWQDAITKAPSELTDVVKAAKTAIDHAAEICKAIREKLTEFKLLDIPAYTTVAEVDKHLEPVVNSIGEELGTILEAGKIVSGAIQKLETEIGNLAIDSKDYAARKIWLDLAEKREDLTKDLIWEKSKIVVQKRLEADRKFLMDVRQSTVEEKRKVFSTGMSEIWQLLRQDTYSSFKEIFIPPASGKGFDVSIQVLATLDDKIRRIDVDALKVFSESQTNVLGIAAFITRALAMGHKFIILDDPVQSMDEDHFKTMARDLLKTLLGKELQVVVLTHNDTFARNISFSHHENEKYLTQEMKHSRKNGCTVIEGNRRVSERLKLAKDRAEDGDMAEAWRFIRISLERYYTLIKTKFEAGFDPMTWRDMTVEFMWGNGGVGVIMETKGPEGCSDRLKEIYSETHASAHDKGADGLTDVINACTFIRSLFKPLGVHD